MDESKVYNLSKLGVEASNDTELSLIFEILRDSWHPKDNPDGYISMGVAENALLHDRLAEYVQKNVTFSPIDLTYGAGGMGSMKLRKAVARFLTRHLKPFGRIEMDHVTMTNGCSSAVEHCSYLLSDPGDYFLLGQPYYGTFMMDVHFRPKTEILPVPFGDVDPISIEAVNRYEEVLNQARANGKKVKGMILCHPHNPLGRCYPREALIEFMKLCQKHRIHFISDEIYALSVWPNKEDLSPPAVPFESATSIDLTGLIDPHLVHVIWGISKDFGANGLRVGAVISQGNPAFVKALQTVALYSYLSSVTDNVVTTLLEDDTFTDKYIEDNQRRLSEVYSHTVKILKAHKIEYKPGSNAGFFLWMNLGKAYMDRHPDRMDQDISQIIMTALLDRKVFLANGLAFGSERSGWFRLIFSQPEDLLDEGLKRVIAAIEA
jgi:aspartate/methionine/tyrosine aminotransferase